MFSLRIHSVDTNSLLAISSSNDSTSTNPNPNLKIQESRGIIHLYRNISKPSSPNLSSEQSTLLFIVAVPSYVSSVDFLRFCGSYIEYVSEIFLVRNDAMEDRYSVLIKLVDQLKTNEFYRNFNGRRFSATEAEVCHILLTVSVEYTELAEIASTVPLGFTELPTCPVCLERLDQDTSGILMTLCDHSFQCPCISKWTDSSCLVCRFCKQQAEKPRCSTCGTSEQLWICVICGFIGCGRYKERHAIQHWRDTQHCYSLDLENQRVWDYVGHTYVHRLNQSKTDGKSEGLHSYCRSSDGDCVASEESGISGSPLSSKIEEIVDEYNHFLASELEIQRQYYEKLLVEAKIKKEKSVPEGVEKAVNSKMQEFDDKIKRTVEAKNAVAASNERLMKEQEIWRKKLKEIEERMPSNNNQRYYCSCGAGFCNITMLRTETNPNRLFIICPNQGRNNGCGLWQWHGEVKMCRCNAGICSVKTCKNSVAPANVGRRFYSCPRSSAQSKGCGFFEWLDPPVETNQESNLQASSSESSQRANSTGGSSKVGELRRYFELKREITIEVYDELLEKMKDLGIEK